MNRTWLWSDAPEIANNSFLRLYFYTSWLSCEKPSVYFNTCDFAPACSQDGYRVSLFTELFKTLTAKMMKPASPGAAPGAPSASPTAASSQGLSTSSRPDSPQSQSVHSQQPQTVLNDEGAHSSSSPSIQLS